MEIIAWYGHWHYILNSKGEQWKQKGNAATCMLNNLALLAVVIKTYTYCDSQTLNFSLREDSGWFRTWASTHVEFRQG